MPHKFENYEKLDMIRAFIICNEVANDAVALYLERFPERRQPEHRIFKRLMSSLEEYGSFEKRDFDRRITFCEWYIGKCTNDPDFKSNIIWSDESRISSDGLFNRNNHHEWRQTNEHLALRQRRQGRPASYPGARQNVDGIIRQTSQSNPDESYEYSYETVNGIKVEERGIPSNLQDLPIISSGSFQYLAPDNTPIAVKYVANENGFQPEGPHLPTPPPIPPQIVRALEWNAAHPQLNIQ
ncbi:cuticle protein [Holotrichia oblita]|uniref:Cuticle protein n=1 Tax=Holotrichia oblita TaxID=644536 RepID=A0ACB9TGB6_HOLOL|nr:cuticle protein [Holotrichia oblita]